MSPSYRLTAQLEAGDLAELYKASQESGGLVVVKLFHAKTSDPAYARALAETSRVLNRLNHAGIVHYVDIGFVKQRLAVVREHVDGHTLGTALQRLQTKEILLPATIALYFVIQLLELVQKAHEAGVIHGALTPGNLILSREGAPGICDFGALSALMAVPELKRSFAPRGRSAYRAPEVSRGEEPSTLSDIYSLGAIAYELLTLREAVVANSGVSTRNGGLPAPSRLDRRINSRLDPLILRALEPLPSRRYRSAGDFAAGLRNFLGSHGGVPNPEELRRFVRELVPNEKGLPTTGPVPFSQPFQLTPVSGAEMAHVRAQPLEASVVTRPSFTTRSGSPEEAIEVTSQALPLFKEPRVSAVGEQESTRLVPLKAMPWAEESTQMALPGPVPSSEDSTQMAPHKPVPWGEESTQMALPGPAPSNEESTQMAPHKPVPWGDQESTQMAPHKPVPWAEESTQMALPGPVPSSEDSTQMAPHKPVPWGDQESTQPTFQPTLPKEEPALEETRLAATLLRMPRVEPLLEPTPIRPPKALPWREQEDAQNSSKTEPALDPSRLKALRPEASAPQESTQLVLKAPVGLAEETDPDRVAPQEKDWEAPPGAAPAKPRKPQVPMVGLPGAKEGTRVGRNPRLKWVEDFSEEKKRDLSDLLEEPATQPARGGTAVRAALAMPPSSRPPPSFVRPPPDEDVSSRDTAPRERPEIPKPPPTDESALAVTGPHRMHTEERDLLALARRQRRALGLAGAIAVVGLFAFLLAVQFGPPSLLGSDSDAEQPVPTDPAAPRPKPVARPRDNEAQVDADSAFMSIRTNLPARVYVDGELVGRRTPLMKFAMKPGNRLITLETLATKERAEFSRRFEKGQHRTIDHKFESIPRR